MKRLALGAGAASTGVVLFSLVSLALAGRAQDSEAPPAVQRHGQPPFVAPPIVVPPIDPPFPHPPFPHPRPAPVSLGEELRLETQRAQIEIARGTARTKLKQTFRNPTNRTVEGTYLFPLPTGAAISGFAMTVNG